MQGGVPVLGDAYLLGVFSPAHVFPIVIWQRSKEEVCKQEAETDGQRSD